MKKEQVLGLLRHSLTFIGGLLVAKGLVDDALVAELSGAILTLVGGAWSILVKK
jgi:hypothetical protein